MRLDFSDGKKSKKDRQKSGQYYTPEDLISLLGNALLGHFEAGDVGHIKVLDPACGTGNFLQWFKEQGVKEENLYGIEIEKEAALQAKAYLPKAHIECANALRTDWRDLLEPDRFTLVVGNPPFRGQNRLSKEQAADMDRIFGLHKRGWADYCASWFLKTASFLSGSGARFGFISPSSMTKGSNVYPVWAPLLEDGWHIEFGKDGLIWEQEGADVAVNAICLTQSPVKNPISPHSLLPLPPVLAKPADEPQNGLPPLRDGNRETKGRINAYQFIHGPRSKDYSVLWLPRHFSQKREYFLAGGAMKGKEPTNALYWCEDESGFAFSVVETQMFMAWQKMIGGRLKAKLRLSNLIWNTFPLPPLTPEQRGDLIEAGNEIKTVRDTLPGSLADIYAPGHIPPKLKEAHNRLDAIMDSVFSSVPFKGELDRQRCLLNYYVKNTQKCRPRNPLPLPLCSGRFQNQP